MLLGCLANPDSRSTERTSRKEYHIRLPERDATAMLSVLNTLLGQKLPKRKFSATWTYILENIWSFRGKL